MTVTQEIDTTVVNTLILSLIFEKLDQDNSCCMWLRCVNRNDIPLPYGQSTEERKQHITCRVIEETYKVLAIQS